MGNDGTSLGDRMKAYEHCTRYVLPRRTYSIVRVDGRAFHNVLRDAERPFDGTVMDAMGHVAEALCVDMSGAQFAYTQSDEVSVLLTDFQSVHTEPWFGGGIQKIASSAAATATAVWKNEYGNGKFDARVFTIPEPSEVANYFLWRQRDCTRNSIMMAGQANFRHAELQNKHGGEIQELLWRDKQINWNDYPTRAKRGQLTEHPPGSVRPVMSREPRPGPRPYEPSNSWRTIGAPIWDHPSLLSMVPEYE